MCAPDKQAGDAECQTYCMFVLSPNAYVNYIENQFITIRQVSDLSEPVSVAQLVHCQKED
jgi:aspartate carbamoyltransferase regulatory subunit